VSFEGSGGIAVGNNATTQVWLDGAGSVQTGTARLPDDRTSFVPLAEVTSEAGAVTSITDLRGETFLMAPSLSLTGVTASVEDVNRVLDGVNATVDATSLNALTAGTNSSADTEHRHQQTWTDSDGETEYRLINASSGSNANIRLRFDLPGRLPSVTDLVPDVATGFLRQRYGGSEYALPGTVHADHRHEGELTASESGRLLGVVPIDGVVSDVILSVGQNIESDTSGDGITATVNANDIALCSTDPELVAGDGSGFRSTAQGDGTAASVKSDGTESVSKGDVLSVDLVRSVSGTVSQEATDVVVLVVIRANGPE
jgi:hypothetical protein